MLAKLLKGIFNVRDLGLPELRFDPQQLLGILRREAEISEIQNDRNLLLSSGDQESKNSRNSYRSARRREPQAGAGQANGPAILRCGWTVSDKGLLCQLRPGLQAQPDDLPRDCLFHFFRARTAGALKALRTMAIWM